MNIIAGLPEDQHDYGMAKGHSPVAEKVAAIDFDGTIVPWGPLMGDKEPIPGARETIDAWRRAGYTIVIFTSRLSRTWAKSVVGNNGWEQSRFLDEQHDYVARTLRKAGIEFSYITSEKIPCEFYVDDKAVGFRGDWQNVVNDDLCKVRVP